MIPGYLENRHKELATLLELLGARNFARIAEIAHRMIGVGAPYGFDFITDHARALKKAADAGDHAGLSRLLEELGEYLRTVRIETE